MGYIDAETMIEYKNKAENRYHKKIHTICRIYTVHERNPLLITNSFFIKELEKRNYLNDSLTYAFGNNTRYYIFKSGNGNGFVPDDNDFLHHKKTYTGLTVNISEDVYSWKDFLKFLFNPQIVNNNITNFEVVYGFPGDDPTASRRYYSVKVTFDIPIDNFITQTNLTGISSFMAYPMNFSPTKDYQRYKGMLYIVKNAFTREGCDTKFCEDVIAAVNLIISINRDDENNQTHVYISQKKR